MSDDTMQLVVELACTDPVAWSRGEECIYCGAKTDVQFWIVDHIPFCTWLRAFLLAQPWLSDEQKRDGAVLHRCAE